MNLPKGFEKEEMNLIIKGMCERCNTATLQ